MNAIAERRSLAWPLVEMADMERAESTVTVLARVMMRSPCQIPAWPTTHVSLEEREAYHTVGYKVADTNA